MLHICACVECAPRHYPPEACSTERTSERHVGVRFITARERISTRVYIDGRHATRVYEALVGRDGWALVYPLHAHNCQGCYGGQPCLDIVRGHVTLELTPEEERA
jgi:hypothetical protein